MRRSIALSFALMIGPVTSKAEYFTYFEWQNMPLQQRAAYVTGMYDGLTTFVASPTEEKVAAHYRQCVIRLKITNVQLAENVLKYAEARPEVQKVGVGSALIGYLISLCGRPE